MKIRPLEQPLVVDAVSSYDIYRREHQASLCKLSLVLDMDDCEVQAVDAHHILGRVSHAWWNLIEGCRPCHDKMPGMPDVKWKLLEYNIRRKYASLAHVMEAHRRWGFRLP